MIRKIDGTDVVLLTRFYKHKSVVRERYEKSEDTLNGMMADSDLPPAKQLSVNDFFNRSRLSAMCNLHKSIDQNSCPAT
jgi:predicted double-glycine peptidase